MYFTAPSSPPYWDKEHKPHVVNRRRHLVLFERQHKRRGVGKTFSTQVAKYKLVKSYLCNMHNASSNTFFTSGKFQRTSAASVSNLTGSKFKT
jgi:hypothetical protein